VKRPAWRAALRWRTHEIKGQAVAAFVTLKEGVTGSNGLADELRQHVARKIGAIARPDDIIFAADLPKARSGKIMRAPASRHRRRQGARGYDDTGRSERGADAEIAIRGQRKR
jgi:acyl-coenzyme A synthetase/AMP-(fatty) acid ligase